MAKARVLIVGEHPVVAEGLEHFLRGYGALDIVATVEDCREGLEKLRREGVDVVILDLAQDKVGGGEAIRLYLEEIPDLQLIFFSENNDETSVFQALKAGAKGYILKSSPLTDLVEAIREIRRGGYALSPSLNPSIVRFYLENRDQGGDHFARYQSLSDREKQVFRLLAAGMPTREIADILCISPKTVAKHRVAVKKKLVLTNAAQMARYAVRIGVIDLKTAQ